MHIVIVGGGLAGLATAKMLRQRLGTSVKITVLESRDRCGGRVRSVYDRYNNRLMYESGPWRIAESHRRVRELCSELELTLQDLHTPTPPTTTAPVSRPGLSAWEAHALSTEDPTAADQADLHTGYANEMDGAGLTYAPTANESYSTLREGFTKLTETLEARVQGADVRICTSCQVQDLAVYAQNGQRKYRLTCSRRRHKDGGFESVRVHASAVFVCVPPHACDHWQALRRHARPVLEAVVSKPLNHIYYHGLHPANMHHMNGRSLLAQTISTQYPQPPNACADGGDDAFEPPYAPAATAHACGWYQLSYSAGRVARFWFNLFVNDVRRFLDLLTRQASAVFDLPRSLRLDNLRVHFWEHAVHMWRPTPNFSVDAAVAKARRPHPTALPQLYFVGEAYSKEQAWMEGALSTAYAAVDDFLARQQKSRADGDPDGDPVQLDATRHLVIDGRILDVSGWARSHPGGESAIRNHMHGKDPDAHDVFSHIGHSGNAWAVIFGLQVGFV